MSTEDSGHYMLYTFFYYNQHPLTSQSHQCSCPVLSITLTTYHSLSSPVYLIPPFLYALLFSVTFSNGLLQVCSLPVYSTVQPTQIAIYPQLSLACPHAAHIFQCATLKGRSGLETLLTKAMYITSTITLILLLPPNFSMLRSIDFHCTHVLRQDTIPVCHVVMQYLTLVL